MKIQELNKTELLEIAGGDNVTQGFFKYLGSVYAGIVKGQPHASYGKYAGMY
jgi:hypothetical protein